MALWTIPVSTESLVFAVRKRRISAMLIVSQGSPTDELNRTHPMQTNSQEQLVPKPELMHLRASHTHKIHARTSMPLVCCSTLSRTLEHFERRKRKTRSKCFIVLNCSWDSQRCTDFTQTFSI